jgi:hypothetical protein
MVDWTQIIPAALITGIVLFILQTNFSEFSQPRIEAELVNKTVRPPFWDPVLHKNLTREEFYINIKNVGTVQASDLRVTLYFINGDARWYRIIFSSENATFLEREEPNKIVIKSPKLSPYGSIYLHAIIMDAQAPKYTGSYIKNPSTVTYNGSLSNFTGQYIIAATYKEGGSSFTTSTDITMSELSVKYAQIPRAIPYSNLMVIFGSIIVIIIIATVCYFRFNKKKLGKRIKVLHNNLLFYSTELRNNTFSKKIFQGINDWSKLDFNDLFQANIDDIMKIQTVYTKLNIRNNIVSGSGPPYFDNTIYLDTINSALKDIDWKKYEKEQLNIKLIIVISLLTIGAIVLLLLISDYFNPSFLQ